MTLIDKQKINWKSDNDFERNEVEVVERTIDPEILKDMKMKHDAIVKGINEQLANARIAYELMPMKNVYDAILSMEAAVRAMEYEPIEI